MPLNTQVFPASFDGYFVTDPATASEGKVKRAKRTLARAKALLAEKGWIQGRSLDPVSGKMCLTAAIGEASSVKSKPGLAKLNGPVMQPIIYGLLEAARPAVTRKAPAFTGPGDVSAWNDKSFRTEEQVLALLDKASA